MVQPRPGPGPADRRPGPLPAPVHRRLAWPWCASARAAGLPVTAEATPHHFTLTDAACAGYDPVFKVNPPLRTDDDVAAVQVGLADGALDAIATDHAPHAPHLKELPFDQAPPGMLGLETALALALTELDLPIERVLALLSWQPAAIAGSGDRPRRPDRAGPAGPPVRHRPGARVGGGPGRAGQPGPQHALRRPPAARQGAPHPPRGRARGPRRRGAAVMPAWASSRMISWR